MTDHPLVQPCATFDEWKALRGSYIGGSDAAAILGLSPYRTIGEVWIAKVQAQEAIETGDGLFDDPEMPSRFMEWGTLLESPILSKYERETGIPLFRPGLTLYRHPEMPYIGGTLDAYGITPAGDKRIVEAKTTDGFLNWREQLWGPSGSDVVPDWYLVQLLHYLIVRRQEGFTAGDFAVLIGGNDFRIFHIAYDSELAEIILAALADFWQMVTERRAPNLDYTNKNAVALQRRIWRKVEGTSIVVPSNYRLAPSHPTVLDLLIEHDDMAAVEELAKERKEAARAELMHIAGNNGRVEIEGTGLAITRRERKGYAVAAYEVQPGIEMSFQPRVREKRKGILNEYRTGERRLLADDGSAVPAAHDVQGADADGESAGVRGGVPVEPSS